MNCGKEVSDDAVFCTGCGAKGAAADTDTQGRGNREYGCRRAGPHGRRTTGPAFRNRPAVRIIRPERQTHRKRAVFQPAPPVTSPARRTLIIPAHRTAGARVIPAAPEKHIPYCDRIGHHRAGLIGGGILTYFLITGKKPLIIPASQLRISSSPPRCRWRTLRGTVGEAVRRTVGGAEQRT